MGGSLRYLLWQESSLSQQRWQFHGSGREDGGGRIRQGLGNGLHFPGLQSRRTSRPVGGKLRRFRSFHGSQAGGTGNMHLEGGARDVWAAWPARREKHLVSKPRRW